jgi:DNA polymerase-3 subunit chi
VTEIAFHFGAPDKLAYACRLLRKAAGSGAKVVVVGDAATVSQLDADLWAVSATDFIPHCQGSAEAAVQKRSVVILTSSADQVLGERDVLVNLGSEVPDEFSAFSRLIEVVSTDALDRDLARSRWKFYTERGYAITRHDLALKRTD